MIESEADTAIACCDMHDLKRHSASSVFTAVHRSLFELVRRMRQKSKVVSMVSFGVFVLLGLPGLRRASVRYDFFWRCWSCSGDMSVRMSRMLSMVGT